MRRCSGLEEDGLVIEAEGGGRKRSMADLNDGESVEMKGSAAKPYVLKNVGGVYSCTCPAWQNQSIAIERRTCKHLRKLRGVSVGTGFSDREREAPPPVGTVITFRFQELSEGGVPRFPSFVRMRGDAVGPTTPKADAKASVPAGPRARYRRERPGGSS